MHIEITQIHTITSEIELLLTEHRRALGTDINIHNQNGSILKVVCELKRVDLC